MHHYSPTINRTRLISHRSQTISDANHSLQRSSRVRVVIFLKSQHQWL